MHTVLFNTLHCSSIHAGGHRLPTIMWGSVCPLRQSVKPGCNNSSSNPWSSTQPAASPDRLLSPLQLFHIRAKPHSRASTSHRGCSHLNMHGETRTALRHASPNQPCRSHRRAARRSGLRFHLVETVQLFLQGGYCATSADIYMCCIDYRGCACHSQRQMWS